MLIDTGDLQAGREEMQAVYDIQRRVLGESNQYTVITRNNLAMLAIEANDPEGSAESAKVFADCIRIANAEGWEGLLPFLERNRGRALLVAGQYEQAETQLLAAYKSCEIIGEVQQQKAADYLAEVYEAMNQQNWQMHGAPRERPSTLTNAHPTTHHPPHPTTPPPHHPTTSASAASAIDLRRRVRVPQFPPSLRGEAVPNVRVRPSQSTVSPFASFPLRGKPWHPEVQASVNPRATNFSSCLANVRSRHDLKTCHERQVIRIPPHFHASPGGRAVCQPGVSTPGCMCDPFTARRRTNTASALRLLVSALRATAKQNTVEPRKSGEVRITRNITRCSTDQRHRAGETDG